MAMVCVAATASLCACNNDTQQPAADNQPIKIIFETDMGNDVDDALALDMLLKYHHNGQIELLGISTNKPDTGSLEFLDIMTDWYGHPEIPLGYVQNGVLCHDGVNYANSVYTMTDSLGNPVFTPRHTGDGFAKPSVELYRTLLSQQPDSSVTIVSVGFSTNLAQLLESQPDSISDLGGYDLVSRKVNRLVTMAGNFVNPNWREYNVVRDVPSGIKVFSEWPTPVVTSPFELGEAILYPASSIENDFEWAGGAHPMVEAYKAYMPMPYNRPTWDLTAVLYAVEGPGDYFTVTEAGDIAVDSLGITTFTENPGSNRRYLVTDSIQRANILNRFIELITTPVERDK